MRALALVLVLLASLGPAHAQTGGSGEEVDVRSVRAPAVAVVDLKFPVEVDLVNRAAEPKQIQLYSFLYRQGDGDGCGSELDDRFLGPVDRSARPSFTIPAKASVTYPFAGGLPWYHVANASQVPESGRYVVCVVAYEPGRAGFFPYDGHAFALDVRVANGLPDVDFSWDPPVGNVTTLYKFRAAVGPDPEGDPLTYTWEFGHLTTKGAAVAAGPEVTHAFFHFSAVDRTFLVNLTVHDGFASTTARREIVVLAEGLPAPQRFSEDPKPEEGFLKFLPLPPPLVAALALAALGLARRRRSPR